MLLPLALYGVERRLAGSRPPRSRRSRSRARCTSRSARSRSCSPTRVARRRPWLGAIAAAAGGRGGALVWALSCATRVERPFSEVERYSATLGDFVTRDPGEFERFVYLGWLLPLLAIAGLGCLCFRNTISSSRRLALVLGLGALVPLPARARRESARLRLALAAYAPPLDPGAGAACCRSRASAWPRSRPPRSLVFQKHKLARGSSRRSRPSPSPPTCGCRSTTRSNADEANAVYAQVADAPPGRLLELPPLPPDAYAGSVYLYYAMQAPRERPLGYSTSAPPEAFRVARNLPARARELGVSVVVDYRDGVPRTVRKR